LEELNALMSSEGATDSIAEFTRWTKEHSELAPIVEDFQRYLTVEKNISDARELLEDPSMVDMARQEISESEAKRDQIEIELHKKLLPKDINDGRNVFLEIRAGTGGEESALFVADLLRMYVKYSELKNWSLEIISEHQSDLGGFKEVITRISGEDVYSFLKFESGGHRVQRVPDTETQGRVHTSACTVAVLPEPDELEDVTINPADIRIDTFRASGAGGQHVNKTDSAIRITHIPSGMVVECQDDRSQHKNKARALSVLAARLNDLQRQEQHNEEAATRKTLVGTGDRSQRIRTYNFPQGRVTDHRINLTLYKLAQIMEGDLTEIVDSLLAEHQAELLAIADGPK
jgi:peptide chain release factor 1